MDENNLTLNNTASSRQNKKNCGCEKRRISALRRQKIVLASFAVAFVLAFIAVGYSLNAASMQVMNYQTTLENTYKSTFYELLDNVNNLDTNLSKVDVTSNEVLQEKYLRLVNDNCKYAQSNLSKLPVSMNTINNGVKFINQLDGYCTSLVNQNGALTNDQKLQLRELHKITINLKDCLNKIVAKLLTGYSILDNSIDNDNEFNSFSKEFASISSDTIEYPSLIFDGPFSDSLYNREIKGLPSDEITSDEGSELIGRALSAYKVTSIKYAGISEGNFVTYDYEVNTDANVYFAQVTKQGGLLLTFSGYSNNNEQANYTVAQCSEIALNFANSLNFASTLKDVWHEENKGICYINLAPVENSITFYPDLIKVKVDMASGLIIGWEAQNYAYNHTTRTNLSAAVGATEARGLLMPTLNVNSQKLCIVPLEYGGEALCYEFNCEYYGNTYYVYINAQTGNEERILKVIQTQEGSLTE